MQRDDYETLRIPSVMYKRTIRIRDERGDSGAGGTYVLRHCNRVAVEQNFRNLTPTDAAKMQNSRLEY